MHSGGRVRRKIGTAGTPDRAGYSGKVVVPSVSRADGCTNGWNNLGRDARPGATLAKPASVAGFKGPPTSGALHLGLPRRRGTVGTYRRRAGVPTGKPLTGKHRT